jgi:subtilisin family serine protease
MMAVRSLVRWMAAPEGEGGRRIDVINMSLGYYHETPEDELFDHTLAQLLVAARKQGCAIVCSAGNDATDRPAFPAALWDWPGADFVVEDPRDVAPHLSVGALNPNRRSVALFSNIGGWVRVYAPGVSVLSTTPPFNGGIQAGTRSDRYGLRRETIDPDDCTGGFGLWSGTSFAAPHIAGLLAAHLTEKLMKGPMTTASRIDVLNGFTAHLLETHAGRAVAPS